MAKDRKKDQRSAKGAAGRAKAHPTASASEAAGGQHHAAKAHGQPAQVDTSLPATRPELLALHAEARRRRNAARLGSDAFRAAVEEIARIEIRVADIERAQDPPPG
jgi:hypothetical protein